MIDCIVVVSGGMDSVTLLHHLVITQQRMPVVLSFNYGQKHTREIEFAKYHVSKLSITEHDIIDLSPIQSIFASSALVADELELPKIETVQGDPQPTTYVPNRNMLFLAIAAAKAETLGVTEVFYGAQRHDMYGYWDTTPEFLDNLNQVFALNRRNQIEIKAPFINNSKADILRIGLKLKLEYEKTWSCYAGQDKACGQCPTCGERLAAFAELNISDPLAYI